MMNCKQWIATASLALASASAMADLDRLQIAITSPTAAAGTLYFGSFPANTNITYTLRTNNLWTLKVVTQLDITVNGVSLFGGPQTPFNQSNACQGVPAASPNTCNAVDAFNANMTAAWRVPAAGDYTIVISGRALDETGASTEFVSVAQLVAEFPAPGSTANAYINAKPRGWFTGVQRGCIIRNITEQQTKFATYGPKGGPYDTAAIQAAVDSFASGCRR